MSHEKTLPETYQEICNSDAPLALRLAAYGQRLREVNAPMALAYDRLVERLRTGEIGTASPAPGEAMPRFILPGSDGGLVDLEKLLDGGPVVVSFNRGHWCPFCKIELRTLASYAEEIARLGARVVSIVPDRQEYAARLRAEAYDRIIVATDMDNGYALSLDLVIWLDETVRGLMQDRGLQLEIYQGNEGWFVPLPATFVVGRDGKVVLRHIDPEFRNRMGVDEILSALARC